MTKQQAKKEILDYFKNNSIPYQFLNETKGPVLLDSSDTVYLCVEMPDVIGKHIETCVRFCDEYLYCQSYYCQPIVQNEEEAMKAARIVNYLNMNLQYDCNSLYEHTFVLDEEEGDIFNGCLIRYELLEEYFSESMDHILNFSVQQLVDVCIPIVFYISGHSDYFEATKIGIDHKLMGRPIPGRED